MFGASLELGILSLEFFFGIWCLVLGIFFVWGLHSIVPTSFPFDVALERL
jgi:hypothetical protein